MSELIKGLANSAESKNTEITELRAALTAAESQRDEALDKLRRACQGHQEWIAAGMKAGFVFSVGPKGAEMEHNPELNARFAELSILSDKQDLELDRDAALKLAGELREALVSAEFFISYLLHDELKPSTRNAATEHLAAVRAALARSEAAQPKDLGDELSTEVRTPLP